jgi:two-component system cell cycle response regulator
MNDYNLLPCGVFIIGASISIQYCNASFALLINTTVDKIVDRPLDDFLSNGSKTLLQQIVLPSILNEDQINEVHLNFINPEKQKVPMIFFARRDKTHDNKIIFCCFSAAERDKLLNSLNQSKSQLQETNAQLKYLSKTDELTGCFNRREMQLKMIMIRRQVERRKLCFSGLMLDLDNFKHVNDNYGHAEGDRVLKQFADLLMCGARFDDVVVRYGGEEFLIILPEANADSAMIAADRIHENMSKILSKAGGLTVSVGVCVAPYDSNVSDYDIIDVADKALYKSKTSGKNKTTLLPISAS